MPNYVFHNINSNYTVKNTSNMPRGKKEVVSKRSKKAAEEVEDDEVEEEVEEEEVPKKKKVPPKKQVKRGSKAAEEDEDDDLSDIDVNEESSDNSEGAEYEKPNRSDRDRESKTNKDTTPVKYGIKNYPVKDIDPKKRIGELGVDEILMFLIKKGEKECNSGLRFGSTELLMRLRGERTRRPNYNNHNGGGSKRNNYGPNPNYRGGRGGRGAFNNRGNNNLPRDSSHIQEWVYDDK